MLKVCGYIVAPSNLVLPSNREDDRIRMAYLQFLYPTVKELTLFYNRTEQETRSSLVMLSPIAEHPSNVGSRRARSEGVILRVRSPLGAPSGKTRLVTQGRSSPRGTIGRVYHTNVLSASQLTFLRRRALHACLRQQPDAAQRNNSPRQKSARVRGLPSPTIVETFVSAFIRSELPFLQQTGRMAHNFNVRCSATIRHY